MSFLEEMIKGMTPSGNLTYTKPMHHIKSTIYCVQEKSGKFSVKVQGYANNKSQIGTCTPDELSGICFEIYGDLLKIDILARETNLTDSQEKQRVLEIINKYREKYGFKQGMNRRMTPRIKNKSNVKVTTSNLKLVQIPPIPVYAEHYETVNDEVKKAMQNLKLTLNSIGVTIPEI